MFNFFYTIKLIQLLINYYTVILFYFYLVIDSVEPIFMRFFFNHFNKNFCFIILQLFFFFFIQSSLTARHTYFYNKTLNFSFNKVTSKVINDSFYTTLTKKKLKLNSTYIFIWKYILIFKNASLVLFSPILGRFKLSLGPVPRWAIPFAQSRIKARQMPCHLLNHVGTSFQPACVQGRKKVCLKKNQYLTTVFSGEGGGKRGFLDFPTGR